MHLYVIFAKLLRHAPDGQTGTLVADVRLCIEVPTRIEHCRSQNEVEGWLRQIEDQVEAVYNYKMPDQVQLCAPGWYVGETRDDLPMGTETEGSLHAER